MTPTSRKNVELLCKKAVVQHEGDARKTLAMLRAALGARIEQLRSQELQEPNPRSSSVALAPPSRRSSRRPGSPGPAAAAAGGATTASASAGGGGGGAGATLQIEMAELAAAAQAGRESRVSIISKLTRSMHIVLLAALEAAKKSSTGSFTGSEFMAEHRRVSRHYVSVHDPGEFWDVLQHTQAYGFIGVHAPRSSRPGRRKTETPPPCCYGPAAAKNTYSVQDIPEGEVESTIALLMRLIEQG